MHNPPSSLCGSAPNPRGRRTTIAPRHGATTTVRRTREAMTSAAPDSDAPQPVPSGTPGLDDVMRGGFRPYGLYLIEGDPGSGKTTLSLQFMMEGVRRGERCMYVTLSEDEKELRAAAASHGWSLDGIDIFEIIASEESLTPDARYTMYHPSEV